MSTRTLFDRLSEIGSAAQATIPGLYAWGVTVAPAAWGRGAPLAAKIVALLGVVLLLAAVLLERSPASDGAMATEPARPSFLGRFARHARPLSVWGLVATSALVWALAPGALSPARLDAPRGVAGMIGWALFAFASAAPAIARDPESSRVTPGPPLRPRSPIPRGDAWFILGGTVFALGLQVIGWRVVVPERALLVRLVALASGLGVIGAATQITLARHARRVRPSRRSRVRRSLVWLAALTVLALGGLALLLAGR